MNGGAARAAVALAEVLEGLQIPYMVGGSMACIVWGEPRFTQDVDFVVGLKARHIDPLLSALGDKWYADREMVSRAIELRSSFNFIHLEGMVKVDVFVPEEGGFDDSKWSRTKRAIFDGEGGRALVVTSAEDIILQKLIWHRKGGEVSEQQWRDITSLLKLRSDKLDNEYLEKWAITLDLLSALAKARAEADQ